MKLPRPWARLLGAAPGVLMIALFFTLSLVCIVLGSFAVEAMTGWPDWATVMIATATAFLVPPLGMLLAIIGIVVLIIG